MSRAPLLSRAPLISRASIALSQNLFAVSKPQNGADLYNYNAAFTDHAWPAFLNTTRAVRFPDNTITRWAYMYFGAFNPAKYYALSVYVQMEDNSVPVINNNLSGSDCMMVFGNNTAVGTPVRVEGTNVYRLCYVGKGTIGGILFGIVKYASNSNKALRVTGYQLEEGTSVGNYKETYGGAYNIGSPAQLLALKQNNTPNSNRPDMSNWAKGTGVQPPVYGTTDTDDPENKGLYRASKISYDGSAYVGAYKLAVQTGSVGHKKPQLLTVWLRLLAGTRLMALGNNNGVYNQFTVTNMWQKFKVPLAATFDNFIATFSLFDYQGDNSPFTFYFFNAGSVDGTLESPEFITGPTAFNIGDIPNILT